MPSLLCNPMHRKFYAFNHLGHNRYRASDARRRRAIIVAHPQNPWPTATRPFTKLRARHWGYAIDPRRDMRKDLPWAF